MQIFKLGHINTHIVAKAMSTSRSRFLTLNALQTATPRNRLTIDVRLPTTLILLIVGRVSCFALRPLLAARCFAKRERSWPRIAQINGQEEVSVMRREGLEHRYAKPVERVIRFFCVVLSAFASIGPHSQLTFRPEGGGASRQFRTAHLFRLCHRRAASSKK